MSRLFDLEDDVLKARKKGNQRTSQARSYDLHAKPSSSQRGRTSGHSRQASYAIPLSTREETQYGTITDVTPDGGKIEWTNDPNVTITYKITENLIGFTDPTVDNKALMKKVKLEEILKKGVRVTYKALMDGDTHKTTTVQGASLDLMGPDDIEGWFDTHYVVRLNGETLGKGQVKWDNLKLFWAVGKLPTVTRQEWQWNYMPEKKLPLRMVLKRADYPHISGVALRRYETETTGQGPEIQCAMAMYIVRPGSHYIPLKPGEVPGFKGLHLTPGGRFITTVADPKVQDSAQVEWDRYWRKFPKTVAADVPQHDPRHVGTHPPPHGSDGSPPALVNGPQERPVRIHRMDRYLVWPFNRRITKAGIHASHRQTAEEKAVICQPRCRPTGLVASSH